MSDAPRPADEIARLNAVRRSRILDTEPESAFDDLARLAASMCETPVALITLVDESRLWFKARFGFDGCEPARATAFCAHTVANPSALLIVRDAREDVRFHDNPLVARPGGVVFYAGAPFVDPDGHALGSLCVIDVVPRELTDAQRTSLEALARQVMAQIDLRRTCAELAELAARERASAVALRANERRLELLDAISDVRSGMRVRDVISYALHTIHEAFPECRAAYSSVRARSRLAVECSVEPSGMPSLLGATADLRSAPEYLAALEAGEVVAVPEVVDDTRLVLLSHALISGGTRALLDVPLRTDGVLTALLCLDAPRARTWTAEVCALLRCAGERLQQLIQNATLEEERGRANERLRESEQRWQLVLRGNNDGIWDWNVRTNEVFFSDRWREMLGLQAEDVSRELGSWTSRIHPEDMSRVMRAIRDHFNHTTEHYQVEYRLQCSDGKYKWILDRGQALWDETGMPVRMTGSHSDITERKRAERAMQESEERFRALADGAAALIWMSDTTRRCTYFNRAWIDFTGRALADELGDGWIEGVHPDDRASCMATYVAAFEAQQAFEMEYRLRHRSGDYRWILDRGQPRHGPDGTFEGFIGSCIDIQGRKVWESQLARARDEAIEASRLKSQFVANMSHEVRTPLNGVLGMSLLLLDTPLDVEQRGYVEAVRSSAESLLSIVNDILDFSKIEAGKLDLETIDFDLRAGIEEIVKWQRACAQSKGLSLTLSIEPEVPVYVAGDIVRLRQILTNLISNAIKFTPNGSIDVRVRALEHDAESWVLKFEVQDTGIGIAAESRSRLFQSFSQADGSTTRRYGGTGLGLVISRQLCGLLGGTMDVDSVLGKGSTFWFSVRVRCSNLSALQATPPRAPLPGLQSSSDVASTNAGGRVLIAEDNVVNQRVATRFLEREGFVVDVVDDGRAALRALSERRYDLILMDCHMPELDGYEATAAIRARERAGERTPIVALTASAMKGDRERCLASGMDDFLSKPLRRDELLALLERWIPARAPSDPNRAR
ncbi:MAG: PAS domain-containing protein [Planctomycetota bacterium]